MYTDRLCKRVSIASTSVTLLIQPTLWPLFDDAVLMGSAGRMRSSQLGLRSQGITDLISAAPAVLLTCRADSMGNESLPNTTAPFTMTLAGASRVVMRAISRYPAISSGNASATINGVACNVSAVSDDGAWAVVETPSALQVCGSSSQDCGYVTLTLASESVQSARGAALLLPALLPRSRERPQRSESNDIE